MNVTFEERSSLHGYLIGIASLDAPNSLNALSLPMIDALQDRLQAWADDPRIACVLLRGNGSKAFCAGGDVVQLAKRCLASPGEVPELAQRFFAHEYRLDHYLHTYCKPLICWAHGHVLGGGMGLLQGASIRIVTPSSRLAMPEVSIGLFPDVGASHFLSRLPGKLGLFFGLTASPMNAHDALDLNLADRFMLDTQQDALIDGLIQLNWREQPDLQLHSLLKALEQQARSELPAAQWLPRRERIDRLLDQSNLPLSWKAIAALENDDDALLAKAARTLLGGCPLTGHLVWEQIRRTRHLSLAQVFQMEYGMSLNCCRLPEFAEGVRARLIDKDHAPSWHWPDVSSVPAQVVESHFTTLDGEHPLTHLG
ncbi:enoyl-CoA hydratase/isomerase family protein [Pseudomonas sp. MM211]|uniref:enoyl-CoA hydratase/isomerase family protein n=1 Tax=Pseudomonas sp. MM211 TaxID=2866808 RepID=UPI001CEC9735|nr:enoyl-CoA hydratase/isomerase family protein [Pseudomonas sp. MM211]UCJ16443.1 enoyl-CoA hydratase/isomerase family protein [Pseudomonas sp. MM211]